MAKPMTRETKSAVAHTGKGTTMFKNLDPKQKHMNTQGPYTPSGGPGGEQTRTKKMKPKEKGCC